MTRLLFSEHIAKSCKYPSLVFANHAVLISFTSFESMTHDLNFLAIDPGLREMGVAHFHGQELIDYGVKSLRRTANRQVRLQLFKRIFERLVDEKQPQLVAIEKNCFSRIPQNRNLMKAIQAIHNICSAHRIPICEIAPNTIKKAVADDGHATKRQVAKAVCAAYPELRASLDSRRKWRERYFQNLFDAVACGMTYLKSNYEQE